MEIMSFIQSVKNFATNILNTAPNNKSVNNSQNNNSIFPSSKENNVNDFSKADSEDVEQYIQDAQNEYEVNNYSVCSTASSVVTSNYPSRGFETVTVTSPDGSKTETVRDSATKQIKGVRTLAGIATFTMLYRYLAPVAITPAANKIGEKINKKKKQKAMLRNQRLNAQRVQVLQQSLQTQKA